MEQEALQTQERQSNITLEVLDHGPMTVHWDELMDAVRASVPNCTEEIVAQAAIDLRRRTSIGWAIWIEGQVKGVCIARPNTQQACMLIYALYGHDLTMDDWVEVIRQFSDIVRPLGYRRISALTTNPRILEIVQHDGWKLSTYCEKEV